MAFGAFDIRGVIIKRKGFVDRDRAGGKGQVEGSQRQSFPAAHPGIKQGEDKRPLLAGKVSPCNGILLLRR